jgi:chromate reductase
MQQFKIGYLIGSLSSASINRRLSTALIRLAPPQLSFAEIAFRDLPLYTPDYDADFPQVARDFKQAIAQVHGVLFVTPEYNSSTPCNPTLAFASARRPVCRYSSGRSRSVFIGSRPWAMGTALAQQDLRAVLSFCNSPQMNSPEAYIHMKPGLVTDEGEVTDSSTEEFLRNFMHEYARFVERVLTVLPRED